MASSLGLIIEREYMERVRRKSFIITTILAPILMIALMAAPTLFLLMGGGSDERTVLVVDNSGVIGDRLADTDELKFVDSNATPEMFRSHSDKEMLLIIGSNAVADPKGNVTVYSHSSLSMMTKSEIKGQLNSIIQDLRLESYDVPGLKQMIADSKPDFNLQTITIDGDQEEETSTEFSYFISLGMDMVLYMFIMIYGQMVMTSIIEEKNNRVLEIIVSSVKPFDLMLGKMTGIGLVAVTQILIWAAIIAGVMQIVMPLIMPSLTDGAAGIEPMPSEIATAIGQAMDPGFLITLFLGVLLFFIGGFLFYASMYAAIGSAVSNVQDASQLSSIATLPVIFGIVGSMSIANDPHSTMAIVLSMIPFTSPMCMMSRLAYTVPAWEIWVSLGILYLSVVFMVWLCAKIYRVGIFMYGKKPNLLEIIKWARYK